VKEIYAKIDENFKLAFMTSVGLLLSSFFYTGRVGDVLMMAGAMVLPAWFALRQVMFDIMFMRALEKYRLTD